MKTLLLKNAKAILPNQTAENVSLLIENGNISKISLENKSYEADEVFDIENTTLFAGFIDINNHGAVGTDVNTTSAQDLRKVSKFPATKGVTARLPTFAPIKYINPTA